MTRATPARNERQELSLHDQICARFRALIAGGRMAPGSRAPSLRSLAVELGVARGTVVAAYDRLIGEGWLTARGTAGTFVADHVPSRGAASAAAATAAQAAPAARRKAGHAAATDAAPAPSRASPRSGPAAPRPHPEPLDGEGMVTAPLQLGLPALDAFPRKVWARLVSHHARRMDNLVKPDTFGLPRLREALAVYLHRSRGVEAQARQVFVVPGYEPALALAIEALLPRGSAAAVEDPGYPPTSQVLRRQGMVPVPVRVDDDGLDVGSLRTAADGARLAVVTPSHQSPTGMSLSMARRRALLDWAVDTDAWILEDDYDGEYRYAGAPLPALKSLDRHERVVYAGTLSKVLYPGLRLAYLVVPPSLVETFEQAARGALTGGCPTLMQEVVADFIEQGHFARHIKRMRTLYAHRRDWLLDALKPHAKFGLSCRGNLGGMHLTIGLPPGADDRACCRAIRDAGLSVHALSDWCQGRDDASGLLASFTNLGSAAEAEEAVARLVAALEGLKFFADRPIRGTRRPP